MDKRTRNLITEYADKYYVPRVQYELIPIRELVCDQKYQRELSKKQVRKTAENFDPYQINPVKVSRRDGKNYVINGQHTMEIIAKVSGSRDTPVWCMIYDELDYMQEAGVFADQMRFVRALTPYDIFIAKIEAGDPDSLMIKAVVESYYLKIGNEVKPGTVCAVKTLEDIYDRLGVDTLSRTLRVCVSTWEGDPKSLSANMLKGLALLMGAYDDRIKDGIFVEKLGEVSIKELTRTAKDRKAGPAGFAEAMLLYYNKKSRGGLSMDVLYKFKFRKNKTRKESSGMRTDSAGKEEDETDRSTLSDSGGEFGLEGIYGEILVRGDGKS